MKKLWILIFATIFIGMLILLSQARVRHVIFNGVIQFPEFAFMQSMRGGLVIRDFSRVLPWLDKQYELANSYGGEKNKLTTGLLENLKKAYTVAVLKKERELFIPVFNKAYLLNPNNIDLNIMLASAYQYSDTKKSFSYLEKARKILPSDQRIFHLANILLRDSDDMKQKMLWCNFYNNEQFGDYENYHSSSLLGGGYRRIAFEFLNGSERDLYLNEGVQIGERAQYEFNFNSSSELISPSLRFSTGGGIEVVFHEIQLFLQGKLIKSYPHEEFILFPETGYIFDKSVISTNPLGENVFIKLDEISIYAPDKIIIDLTISKLSLNSSSLCSN